ncbi:terpene cyclase/mutase family protein [Blastopirellula sp. JC732]|uniref:Terpene cyclase/mutase family protein n=1 Tax=Blastopirellula sediminis TaxID=2894196 RepID=A0A9X1SHS2_9BACT|nr:prenyltransferase/squalene oxidase repeat-containing protein [Blastopirellula sediminis]MCC9607758.1 terpene cyclase/mutase family protein [Blastopirellula sediminis]MCC9627449.1 terpene cyclase/mutase family protein [Blastopirellula sediminis]
MGALLADANSTWLSSHVIWNVMWVGLAVLTISLLVLMQTRWGQAKPLSKCVVLSIFAHLLLIAYAHMTQLFSPGPARTPAPLSFKLSNVAFEEKTDRQSPEQAQAKPWDVTNVAQLPSPQAAPLARPDSQPAVAADAPQDWPLEDAPLSEAIAPPVEMAEPTELVENHTAPVEPSIAPRGSMIAAAEIAAVAAAPVAAEAAAEVIDAMGNTPMAPTLARRDSTGPTVPEATPPQIEPSQDDRHMDDQIHQLAEMAATAAPADAIQSEIDQLRAADNRFDGPTATSPEGSDGTPAQLASARASGDQKKLAQLDQLGVPVPATSRRTLAASPLPLAMQARVADNQKDIIQAQGGDPRIEASIDAALVWLAANQEDDGRWDASRHSAGNEQKVLGHDRYGAGADADTGVTGLAVLAFMARGHTHLEGKHRTNVQHGLEFIISHQHDTGSLAGDARLFAQMYCHGIAMLALSEAYAMTRDDRIRPALEAALNYSFQSQHQTSGGWRYQPGDLGDTSQFGWQVLALHSAQLSGIETPERTRELMTRFLRSVSSGDHNGLASYRPGERTTPVMTAEALVCRVFMDAENSKETVEEAANYLARFEPGPGRPNLYFWYYGTIGMHQLQGERWHAWSASLQRQLLTSQRAGGLEAGSWDPDTVWGCYGGRVYSTAMATLSLEVYFRYLPIYYDLQNRPAPVAQAPLQVPAGGVRISSKPENLAPR